MKTQAKQVVRDATPKILLDRYRAARLQRARRRNEKQTTAEVFAEIYRKGEWGGDRGEFSSGSGTRNEAAVSAYLDAVGSTVVEAGLNRATLVDLGCGDFTVGEGLVALCQRYVGIDVVEELIERNQSLFGAEGLEFICRDAINDELPTGAVITVRQVLQHLDNAQIASILLKLRQFDLVYITEHHPLGRFLANRDKPHGGDTRLPDRSGVVITEPPFDVPQQEVELLLEVSAEESDPEAGVLRTYLWRPGSAPM